MWRVIYHQRQSLQTPRAWFDFVNVNRVAESCISLFQLASARCQNVSREGQVRVEGAGLPSLGINVVRRAEHGTDQQGGRINRTKTYMSKLQVDMDVFSLQTRICHRGPGNDSRSLDVVFKRNRNRCTREREGGRTTLQPREISLLPCRSSGASGSLKVGNFG